MSQNAGPTAPLAAPQLGSRVAVARNALYLVIGQVSTTALAIVFSAALGRSLGAGDFGLYFLISSFATFAYVVVDWGQQFYIIREVARAPARGGELRSYRLAEHDDSCGTTDKRRGREIRAGARGAEMAQRDDE